VSDREGRRPHIAEGLWGAFLANGHIAKAHGTRRSQSAAPHDFRPTFRNRGPTVRGRGSRLCQPPLPSTRSFERTRPRRLAGSRSLPPRQYSEGGLAQPHAPSHADHGACGDTVGEARQIIAHRVLPGRAAEDYRAIQPNSLKAPGTQQFGTHPNLKPCLDSSFHKSIRACERPANQWRQSTIYSQY